MWRSRLAELRRWGTAAKNELPYLPAVVHPAEVSDLQFLTSDVTPPSSASRLRRPQFDCAIQGKEKSERDGESDRFLQSSVPPAPESAYEISTE